MTRIFGVVLLSFKLNKIPTEYIKTGRFHKQNNFTERETIKHHENNSTKISKVLLVPFSS